MILNLKNFKNTLHLIIIFLNLKMNQNEIEKQTLFLKNYFKSIDFSLLYSNFENLYNEYSESDLVNLHINTLIDNFFELNKKDEEIKLVFNVNFLKSINVDNLITCYISEKNGKREKQISDLFKNISLKNVITAKNSLYTKNILLFILFKYYKQIGVDFDKPTEEKLYKFLSSEMNLKDLAYKNESLNIFSNHIQLLYKVFVRKYLGKKEEINNNANNSVRISNDEFPNDSKNQNNPSVNPNQFNNQFNEQINNNTRYESRFFVEKLFNLLISQNADSNGIFANKNFINLNNQGNLNGNLNVNLLLLL